MRGSERTGNPSAYLICPGLGRRNRPLCLTSFSYVSALLQLFSSSSVSSCSTLHFIEASQQSQQLRAQGQRLNQLAIGKTSAIDTRTWSKLLSSPRATISRLLFHRHHHSIWLHSASESFPTALTPLRRSVGVTVLRQ